GIPQRYLQQQSIYAALGTPRCAIPGYHARPQLPGLPRGEDARLTQQALQQQSTEIRRGVMQYSMLARARHFAAMLALVVGLGASALVSAQGAGNAGT